MKWPSANSIHYVPNRWNVHAGSLCVISHNSPACQPLGMAMPHFNSNTANTIHPHVNSKSPWPNMRLECIATVSSSSAYLCLIYPSVSYLSVWSQNHPQSIYGSRVPIHNYLCIATTAHAYSRPHVSTLDHQLCTPIHLHITQPALALLHLNTSE